MSSAPLALGIDLGATHIKGVLLDTDGTPLAEARSETHEQDDAYWKAAVSNLARELAAQAPRPPQAFGLSAPGLSNTMNSSIACMPGRLQGLEGFDWSRHLGHRVWVLNDAHAALMAEASFGAARGKRNVVMLTLGTGVGGAILIGGQLYFGEGQMAGHIGHSTVDAMSDDLDVTGMPGSIEHAIGNVNIISRSGGKFQSTHELLAAVKLGDSLAAGIWDASVRKLAVTLASVINILSPELIVLAGGITLSKELLFGPLERYLDRFEWRPGGKKTPVVQAHFSDRAGAIGAAAFALSRTSGEN